MTAHRCNGLRPRAPRGAALSALVAMAGQNSGAAAGAPDARWPLVAAAMKTWAGTWGDQPYGAVLVLDGAVAGFGPSRVILNANPESHAEREAVRDAQARLGRKRLDGSVLYSTSRPCRDCERAAAKAGVLRMYVGATAEDAGRPLE